MQNNKKKKPITKKDNKRVRFEELLEDDRFDDEDYDTVTGDTLEFLSLNDDVIESYQKEHSSKSKKSVSASKSRSARYSREDEEDEVVYETEDDEDEVVYEDEEDYEDEDYEDEVAYEDEEDYEDEDYEDEDYEDEDEDYEDEDYEYYEDDEEEDGFVARLMHFIGEMNGLDMAVAVLGVLVLAGALVTGGIYVHARSTAKQVAAFASVGEEVEGVSVIGESGLLAVSESAKLGNMIDGDYEDWEETEEDEEDANGEVMVELRLTSILSDMKIKFVNKKTGKLIGGVPFEVEVTGKKNYNLKDDDRDGVIYQTDVAAGNYDVKILPLSGENADKYILPSGSSSVKVTDKIAYEKVDVADEVKSESEINVAQEEANVQHAAVESALKDTVEWVESTKTPIEGGGGDEDYEQVPLDNIADPTKTSSAFRKMTAEGENPNPDEGNGDEEKPDPPVQPEEPKNVEVSLSGLSMVEGGSETLRISGGSDSDYSVGEWKSNNESVATVSGGTVTAKSAGDATITVTLKAAEGVKLNGSDEITLSCTVTVKAKDKTKVTVSLPSDMALKEGESGTLSVSGIGGGKYDVQWSGGNDAVSISGSGSTVKVEAKKAGSATIKAKVIPGEDTVIETSGSMECKVTVTAKDSQVEAKLNMTELKMVKDQKAYLQIVDGSGKTYDAKTYASFEISDKSIADVHSDGQVKALKDGTATIKVKLKSGNGVNFKNTELSCKLSVGNQNYSKVTISGNREVEVGTGQKLTLTAKSEPEGAELVWKCTNETLAKVDKNGVVTGLKEGKTKIQVYCKTNDKISDEIRITVKKAAVDMTAKLKDKNGNQLYYKKDGKYIEATYKDYFEHTHFYKLKASAYRYTGWQTIDGHLYYYDKNGNYVTGEQVIQGAKYTFGSDGRMAKSSGTMGIDVSKHNGNIDWNAVKNSGVSYVIIRCGYRGYSTGVLVEDPKFRSNIQGAKAAGLKVGAYFFSQAVNEVEAVEEASMAIDLVKGYGLNYPLFLDVEGSGGRADGISRDTRTAVCKTFCQTVQNSGIQAGVYANKTWFTEKISTGSLTSYKLWLAQYASAPTYTATRYDLWQYSSKGKVSGISGNVDMNISYVNY